jgi:hypothetical protein
MTNFQKVHFLTLSGGWDRETVHNFATTKAFFNPKAAPDRKLNFNCFVTFSECSEVSFLQILGLKVEEAKKK